jgi:hypothetical protein
LDPIWTSSPGVARRSRSNAAKIGPKRARCAAASQNGEGRNRTGDTTIFREAGSELSAERIPCKSRISRFRAGSSDTGGVGGLLAGLGLNGGTRSKTLPRGTECPSAVEGPPRESLAARPLGRRSARDRRGATCDSTSRTWSSRGGVDTSSWRPPLVRRVRKVRHRLGSGDARRGRPSTSGYAPSNVLGRFAAEAQIPPSTPLGRP